MKMGLTMEQEIVEIRVRNSVSSSLSEAIVEVLAEKRLHRIVSMAVTSSEEFNTASIALLVIEYLE